MSEISEKLDAAGDMVREIEAIMRLPAWTVANGPAPRSRYEIEFFDAIGRAADAGARLSAMAIEILDGLSDSCGRAA